MKSIAALNLVQKIKTVAYLIKKKAIWKNLSISILTLTLTLILKLKLIDTWYQKLMPFCVPIKLANTVYIESLNMLRNTIYPRKFRTTKKLHISVKLSMISEGFILKIINQSSIFFS